MFIKTDVNIKQPSLQGNLNIANIFDGNIRTQLYANIINAFKQELLQSNTIESFLNTLRTNGDIIDEEYNLFFELLKNFCEENNELANFAFANLGFTYRQIAHILEVDPEEVEEARSQIAYVNYNKSQLQMQQMVVEKKMKIFIETTRETLTKQTILFDVGIIEENGDAKFADGKKDTIMSASKIKMAEMTLAQMLGYSELNFTPKGQLVSTLHQSNLVDSNIEFKDQGSVALKLYKAAIRQARKVHAYSGQRGWALEWTTRAMSRYQQTKKQLDLISKQKRDYIPFYKMGDYSKNDTEGRQVKNITNGAVVVGQSVVNQFHRILEFLHSETNFTKKELINNFQNFFSVSDPNIFGVDKDGQIDAHANKFVRKQIEKFFKEMKFS